VETLNPAQSINYWSILECLISWNYCAASEVWNHESERCNKPPVHVENSKIKGSKMQGLHSSDSTHISLQYYNTVWVKKNPPCGFLTFFLRHDIAATCVLKLPLNPIHPSISKRLGIFNQFFTHLLHVPVYTRLQIFIQLFPTLTKLCHTKRDQPANFLNFTRTL